MFERYKVLGAMLALKQFTVEDVARMSGVNPMTVRTVLSRENRLVHDIGRRPTGQPGGQYNKYELAPDQIPLLRSELQELFRQVWAALQATEHPKDSHVIPLSLLAVEDALLRRFPNAKDVKEKQHLLNISLVGLNSGEVRRTSLTEESRALPPNVTRHLRLAKRLYHLAASELGLETGKILEDAKLLRAWKGLESSARGFFKAGDAELAALVERRLTESPLASRAQKVAATELLRGVGEYAYADLELLQTRPVTAAKMG